MAEMSKDSANEPVKLRKLPKGAYCLPTGGYVFDPIYGEPDKKGRRITVQPVCRYKPDLEQLAQAQLDVPRAEQDAQRDTEQTRPPHRSECR